MADQEELFPGEAKSPKKATKKAKDPMRVAVGKKSKSKGKSFERLIVKALTAIGLEAKRGWWQSGEFARYAGRRSQGAKPRVPDVMLDGFWLELGTGIQVDDYKKLDQAETDSSGSDVFPVAITRRKGQRPIYATLRLKHLIQLLEKSTQKDALSCIVSLRLEEFLFLILPEATTEDAGSPPEPMFSGDIDISD